MRIKILVIFISLGLLIIMFSPVYSQTVKEPEFGFTGEVHEYLIKKLPPRIEAGAVIDESKIIDKVAVLMVGFNSALKPTDSDFECFTFVNYYYPETIFDSWVAMIVANYGNVPCNSATLSIEVKGPKSTKIEVKRTIPRNAVMLYVFKFNKKLSSDETGIYELIGQVSQQKTWTSRAITRFYINEIW
jgi:hypothetical protein